MTSMSHTALGQTVDTTIGNTPARVTLITEGALRIETAKRPFARPVEEHGKR
jgi:hypothetical protein